MSSIATWIDTFVEEKELDRDYLFEVPGPSGVNMIPLGAVVDTIKIAPAAEQAVIKRQLIALDFHNNDVPTYLRHLAGALAI
ncbi:MULTISPECIES: hypothetical protein [Mycolicibacter]|uniref:Uncharacterized protein n=2 Tax=Mycolicibacter TaxID=1073531 RepID=A0ABU5XMC9_9MYCO|nr:MULTISPECIES: hypothetical protein [unclassified Mycolicibacter]MEB3023430.1 hypothetical protein [Mycolicibacter sp. MYC098]MEB3033772.1 hypothetical protein [Mycolicibacter sp. MYC340]